jgi:hypothetical protein
LEIKSHNHQKNRKDGELTAIEEQILKDGLKTIDPSIAFEMVDFASQGAMEGAGWDASASREDKEHFGIQWKIRRPDKEATKSVPFLRDFYWKQRGKTFFIEDYDENRPQNKGWLQLYFGNDVDLWAFIWRSHIEEIRFLQIYGNDKDEWLKRMIELDKLKQYKRFARHPEEKNGVTRFVGGFIIDLKDVRDFLKYEIETKTPAPAISLVRICDRPEIKPIASKQMALISDEELATLSKAYGVKHGPLEWEDA